MTIQQAFNSFVSKIENNFQTLDNGKVSVSDIASTVTASSTNATPVGAKLFYDTVGNIETLLQGV